MKRRYAVQIAAGAVLAAAGLLLPFLTSGMEVLSSALVTIGAVLLAVAAVRHGRFRDEPVRDERTRRIGAYGTTYSWVVTLVLILAFLWLDFLGLASFNLQGTLFVLLFTMLISARIFQWYLFRQGDVA